MVFCVVGKNRTNKGDPRKEHGVKKKFAGPLHHKLQVPWSFAREGCVHFFDSNVTGGLLRVVLVRVYRSVFVSTRIISYGR